MGAGGGWQAQEGAEAGVWGNPLPACLPWAAQQFGEWYPVGLVRGNVGVAWPYGSVQVASQPDGPGLSFRGG